MRRSWRARLRRLGADAIIMAIALTVGLYNVRSTGLLWADAPRYANGAAMIHDWLLSGNWLHPYDFAVSYYARYPGFSIPYHPPVYPGLMALFFIVFGVTDVSARAFIAVTLGLGACFFVRILKQLGAGRLAAWSGGIIFLSTPGIVYWSRTTMSEVPALMLITLATLFFVRWLDRQRSYECWLAYLLALAAFLSRLTTAGLLPAWYLFALLSGRWRSLLRPVNVLASIVYLVAGGGWMKFALRFNQFEAGGELTSLRPDYLQPQGWWQNATYHPARLPTTVGWPLVVCAVIAAIILAVVLARRRPARLGLLALSWFGSYWFFQFVLSMFEHNEPRYFCLALPSIPLAIAALVNWCVSHHSLARVVGALVVAGCLASNAAKLARIPPGVVGYDGVAETIVGRDPAGNILTACPYDQDFIFRYRAANDPRFRQVIRSDRSLSIRGPEYVVIPEEVLADTAEEMLALIRQGRIRYLITCAPSEGDVDERFREQKFAHEVVKARPNDFKPLDVPPLFVQMGTRRRTIHLYLWEYAGELPPGPSELPIRIPTAGIDIRPE